MFPSLDLLNPSLNLATNHDFDLFSQPLNGASSAFLIEFRSS